MDGTEESLASRTATAVARIRKALEEVFYGMTVHELERELKKEKGDLHKLLMLMIFGDLVGLPLFPPYYSMRLLPHIIPFYRTWRRNLLRERDITNLVGDL